MVIIYSGLVSSLDLEQVYRVFQLVVRKEARVAKVLLLYGIEPPKPQSMLIVCRYKPIFQERSSEN